MRLFPLALLSAAAAIHCCAQPPEELLQVRLLTHLTSYSSHPGTPFDCVVLRSYTVDGEVLIPQGSHVFGTVRKARKVGLGLRHERAALDLQFERYRTPDGAEYPISARLAGIDNAREEVLRDGSIQGVLAAENTNNFFNGVWIRPTNNIAFRSLLGMTGVANRIFLKYPLGPFGMAGFFVARCTLVSFPEPEIHLTPGVDMGLRVTAPPAHDAGGAEASAGTPVTLQDVGMGTASGFQTWISHKLGPVYYANGSEAPDAVNLVVAGSRDELITAFLGAGWLRADPHSIENLSRVFSAFTAMRNYAAAPVSKLVHEGSAPDLVFEKSFDTVSQRHHVRFWWAGRRNGEDIWLGAATHDIGVTFKFKRLRVSHRIDRNIDSEREKVLTDLHFAGCSGPVAFLERPVLPAGSNLPGKNENAHVVTDGRLAVFVAQSCPAPAGLDEEAPPPPGNRLTRVTRRVVLEARNYLFRDNPYYWGYRMIRDPRGGLQALLH